MIRTSSPFISGVVFSGGEPTLQKEPLISLASSAKKQGLAVGLQTNGHFPGTLESLIQQNAVDKIALDYKTQWEGFSERPLKDSTHPINNYKRNVQRSINICKEAKRENVLSEFEIVITAFYENAEYIKKISSEIGTTSLVLQQGMHRVLQMRETAPSMTNGEYLSKRRIIQENHPPLTLAELKSIADELNRTVRIRTREIGEITYESDWRCRDARTRKR